jgi:hypothetical protein
MKIILGHFNAKVEREIICKPTIGNESPHQDSNDNGVRIGIVATSKNLVPKTLCSRTETFVSTLGSLLNGKTHNQTNHILIDRTCHSSILDV